jgi:hypothetical protein
MNYDQTDQSMPNVQGFERTASIVGGVMLLGCGIRKGGLAGLIEMALGGMAIARGATGRCAMKRALCQACAKGEYGEHGSVRHSGETGQGMSSGTGSGSSSGTRSSSTTGSTSGAASGTSPSSTTGTPTGNAFSSTSGSASGTASGSGTFSGNEPGKHNPSTPPGGAKTP